jgi:hypothetical protein
MKLRRTLLLRSSPGISSNIGAAFITTRAALQSAFNDRASAVEFRGERFLGAVSIPRPPARVMHNTRSFSANPTTSPMMGPSPNLDPRSKPHGGLVYAKLTGTGRSTLKMDIVHFFEGCNLKPEDMKFAYNRNYAPLGMILQFSSRAAYGIAQRLTAIKGRYYRMMEVDRSQWSNLESPFDGKVLLLHGVPQNALLEDVERFFSGCNFDSSSVRFFIRPVLDEPVRFALVSFRSQREAMHALREKNRNVCLNSPITLRLLH